MKNNEKYINFLNRSDFFCENNKKYIKILNGTNFLDTLHILCGLFEIITSHLQILILEKVFVKVKTFEIVDVYYLFKSLVITTVLSSF